MKFFRKIMVIIAVLAICFVGASYIDYYIAKTNNTVPKIAMREENKEKEMIIYKGLFYKMWACTAEETIFVGDYSDNDPVCPVAIEFTDGYYTNAADLKITKKDVELMLTNNIYTKEMIDIMVSAEEVSNAVYVASEYGKTNYRIIEDKKATFKFEDEDEQEKATKYSVSLFPVFTKKGDHYKWDFEHKDEKEYRCIKVNGEDEFEFAKYEDGYCVGEFERLKLPEKWCKLYKNSTLVYSEELVKGVCD